MAMSSFNGLYVNRIHYLRRNGYGVGKLNSRPSSLYKHDETVIALMAVVARNPTAREIKRGKVVSLQEILKDMPTRLRDGMLSWLILEGEAEPSSLIIHTDIAKENITMFAMMRLGYMALEKRPKGPLIFLNFRSKIKEIRNNIEEAKEQAKKSTLANSEPVARFL